jgi:hypothetical protein
VDRERPDRQRGEFGRAPGQGRSPIVVPAPAGTVELGRNRPMHPAGPVEAENAPTGPWKTQNVFHRLHRPLVVRVVKKKKPNPKNGRSCIAEWPPIGRKHLAPYGRELTATSYFTCGTRAVGRRPSPEALKVGVRDGDHQVARGARYPGVTRSSKSGGVGGIRAPDPLRPRGACRKAWRAIYAAAQQNSKYCWLRARDFEPPLNNL